MSGSTARFGQMATALVKAPYTKTIEESVGSDVVSFFVLVAFPLLACYNFVICLLFE